MRLLSETFMVRFSMLTFRSLTFLSSSVLLASRSLQIFFRRSISSAFFRTPSRFLQKEGITTKGECQFFIWLLDYVWYLLVDLSNFGGKLAVKVVHVPIEAIKVLNDPLEDAFESLRRVLQSKYFLEVEWTLECYFLRGCHISDCSRLLNFCYYISNKIASTSLF